MARRTGEEVEKGRLACTARAHEGGQRPRRAPFHDPGGGGDSVLIIGRTSEGDLYGWGGFPTDAGGNHQLLRVRGWGSNANMSESRKGRRGRLRPINRRQMKRSESEKNTKGLKNNTQE